MAVAVRLPGRAVPRDDRLPLVRDADRRHVGGADRVRRRRAAWPARRPRSRPASCSTQPGRGKCWVNSRYAATTGRSSSNTARLRIARRAGVDGDRRTRHRAPSPDRSAAGSAGSRRRPTSAASAPACASRRRRLAATPSSARRRSRRAQLGAASCAGSRTWPARSRTPRYSGPLTSRPTRIAESGLAAEDEQEDHGHDRRRRSPTP